jgi:hypothetical protein
MESGAAAEGALWTTVERNIAALTKLEKRWSNFGRCQIEIPDRVGAEFYIESTATFPQVRPGRCDNADLILAIQGGDLERLFAAEAGVLGLLHNGAVELRAGDPRQAYALVDIFNESSRMVRALQRVARLDALSASGPSPTKEHREGSKVDWERIRQALGHTVPTVFVGALLDAPTPLRSLQALQAEMGECEIVNDQRTTKLRDLVSEIMASTPDQPMGTGGVGYFPVPDALLTYLNEHWKLVPSESVSIPELFLSAAGWLTPLHRDLPGGVVGQFCGTKRWVFFAPRDSQYLYPQYTIPNGYQQCEVDSVGTDLERYPLFARATPIELISKPGDLVVIPPCWFHHVDTLESGLAIRLNVRDEAWT